jgi:hypothetical protein
VIARLEGRIRQLEAELRQYRGLAERVIGSLEGVDLPRQ